MLQLCGCKPVLHKNPRWVANVRTGNKQHEINMTNAMPTRTIFHLLALGVALGVREFALGVWVCVGSTRVFRYQHVVIGNAKPSRWGSNQRQAPTRIA